MSDPRMMDRSAAGERIYDKNVTLSLTQSEAAHLLLVLMDKRVQEIAHGLFAKPAVDRALDQVRPQISKPALGADPH